jgi:NAD(P)-dependent dehydrogenase (short-subunit alcohol dehydrogenase family)
LEFTSAVDRVSPETQQVVAIGGAGQGLGRALAIGFSRAGYRVVLIGRTLAKLEQTQALLPGGAGLIVAADLTDPDQVRSAFARIESECGGLDVLINNSGSYRPFRFDQATDEEIRESVNQNFMAPVWSIRAAIPLLRRRGAGDIVNVSTQSVDTPQPYMIIYAAAKAALEALARGLRNEFFGEPIRILTVTLGVIADSVIDPKWLDHQDAYLAALKRCGLEQTFVFPGATPESITASVLHAVAAPRDIYLQQIDVRGMPPPSQ